MEKLRTYIYGAGNEYNHLMSYIYQLKKRIEILGIITTKDIGYKRIDGVECIRPSEVERDADLFIIAIEKWNSPYMQLKELGISDNRIVRGKAFYVPLFDFDEYMKLKQSRCSIFSNNCLGGIVSEELGLEFLSPTKNMGCFSGKEFAEYLNGIENYLECDAEIIKWNEGNDDAIKCFDYMRIGPGCMWMLNHHINAENALEEWKRRSKRINLKNMAVVMTIRNGNELDAFRKIKIEKKLGITFLDVNDKDIVYLRGWNDPETRFKYDNWFDFYVTRKMAYFFGGGYGGTPIDWISFLNGSKSFIRAE